MSKPTNKPGWTSTSNPSSEPTSKKLIGWSAGEKPSAEHMNWLFKNISEWINHVDVDRIKGETGDQGSQGEVGPAGPQGESGPAGAKGLTGDKGSVGDAGLAGAVGAKGLTGDKGLVGDAGPQGPVGSSSLSASDEARIAALESKVTLPSVSSVIMPLSYQGNNIASEYNAGNSGSAITIDWSNGISQVVTVTNNLTISFANPTSGKVYYLRLKSDGVDNRNLTFVGATTGVSSIANGRTILFSLYWNGSEYIVQKLDSLFGSITGSETKNGYVAGGFASNSALASVEKINFNNDTTTVVIQSNFGKEPDSSGTISAMTVAVVSAGQGTQSATHGYRSYGAYTSLLNVNSNTTTATHKLAFANDTGAVLTIRPAGVSLWATSNRRAIVQSTTAAYQMNSSTQVAKMIFSTDAFSTVTQTVGASATNYSLGMSSLTNGYTWMVTACYKMPFSTEINASISAALPIANDTGGYGEAVDSESVGYYQKTTATTPTATTYKFNKTTEGFTTLGITLSASGGAGSATQGSVNGYFCGGSRVTTAPITSTQAFSDIRKINTTTESLSVNNGSLKAARLFAAGFEG